MRGLLGDGEGRSDQDDPGALTVRGAGARRTSRQSTGQLVKARMPMMIRWVGAAKLSNNTLWLTMWVVTAPVSTNTRMVAPRNLVRRLGTTSSTALMNSRPPTTKR